MYVINPFKPELTIVIFIHYKPRIAVAILDLQWMKMTWSGWQMEKNSVIIKQFNKINCFETPNFRKVRSFLDMQNDALRHREGLKG